MHIVAHICITLQYTTAGNISIPLDVGICCCMYLSQVVFAAVLIIKRMWSSVFAWLMLFLVHHDDEMCWCYGDAFIRLRYINSSKGDRWDLLALILTLEWKKEHYDIFGAPAFWMTANRMRTYFMCASQEDNSAFSFILVAISEETFTYNFLLYRAWVISMFSDFYLSYFFSAFAVWIFCLLVLIICRIRYKKIE